MGGKLSLFDHFWRKSLDLLCKSVFYDAVGSGYSGELTDPTASDEQKSTALGDPTASERGIFGQGAIRRGRVARFSRRVWSRRQRGPGFSRRVWADDGGGRDFRAGCGPTGSGDRLEHVLDSGFLNSGFSRAVIFSIFA